MLSNRKVDINERRLFHGKDRIRIEVLKSRSEEVMKWGIFLNFSRINYVSMNYIDMFVVVLLIYAVFRGITRGLIMQAASLAALITGIFGALKLSGITARYIAQHWNINPEYLYIFSLAITFTLVFILISLLGNLMDKWIETAHLSFLNKILGAIFNVCKVLLLVGIILLFIDRIDNQISILPKNAREGSFFYKPVTSVTRFLFPSLGIDYQTKDNKHEEFV
jgi:membrane protein required for colicin V production